MNIINKRRASGFTLVELLVVVGIVIILSATLMPKFLGYTDRAREARAMGDINTMRTVLEVYAADEGNGTYPNSEEVGEVFGDKGIQWSGDAEGVKDPWGKSYIYESDGKEYKIYTETELNKDEDAYRIGATQDKQPSGLKGVTIETDKVSRSYNKAGGDLGA